MKRLTKALLDKLWLRFSIITVMLLALDQITKNWALSGLEMGKSVDFGWQLVYNDGIVFGINLPIWATFLISGAILILGAYLVVKEKLWQDKWHLAALSMILSGAVGNLIDRIRFGYVIDFIKVYWWPNFNLADVWIVLGVVLMAWIIFIRDEGLSKV